jgi:hypothetical protein
MPTVGEIATRVKDLKDEVTVLQSSIRDSYTKYATGSLTNQSMKFNGQIRDLKEEGDKYDNEFREHERFLQKTGGKPRHQTLQEFVLLFFWTAFTLLTVSLAIFSYSSTQVYGNPLKIVGLMLFIGLLVTAILIRYA